MRFVLLLCVTACHFSDDGAKYEIPPSGGGGGGGGSTFVDAGAGSGSGSNSGTISGKICMVDDIRLPTTCDTNVGTNLGGYSVTLGNFTTTTGTDGTFVLQAPTSSNVVWVVTGTDIETSLMSYSASTTIPVVTVDTYLGLAGSNGVLQQTGYGDVFLHVTHAGASVAAAVATAIVPTPFYAAALYDGTIKDVWQSTATGTYGMTWIAGAPTGATSVTITPQGAGSGEVAANIPVGDQAVTWATLDLP
ncbi:MAG TPA: hypothetical protein VGC41_28925 [Kofleriaceae bacterium]